VKHILLDELQMNEGHLLVRYLVVPFISSRLSATNCCVLLDIITGCIDSWLSRNLSYAGRLQLLSSFLLLLFFFFFFFKGKSL
jgi:hypothetical protein